MKSLHGRFNDRYQFAARCVPFWHSLIRVVVVLGRLAVLAVVVFGPGLARAGSSLTSASAAVNVVAVLPATVGVSISTVHLNVSIEDPSQRSSMVTLPVTSSWNLNESISAVELVGFFDSSERALANVTGDAIPSSRVMAAINNEAPQAFRETASVGTRGAARRLFRQPISRSKVSGSRRDDLHIQVDRVADLGTPAGEYTGTLHLRLIAY
ncbi:MAG TPA: hypothetical protein VMT53_17675 [Terriglobales bacterium]|nr:hypothetical protein [Terriglobales bacterium]